MSSRAGICVTFAAYLTATVLLAGLSMQFWKSSRVAPIRWDARTSTKTVTSTSTSTSTSSGVIATGEKQL